MEIGPSLVLAALVGVFHTALYVLIRGTVGGRLLLIGGAAILGAWAGDAIGARLGLDVLRLGDFRILAASLVAWVGILLVAIASVLGPAGREA